MMKPETDSTFLLTGARVINPAAGLDRVTQVLVRDGVIAAIGDDLASSRDAAGAPREDLTGHILAPGLIDLHVHLREPGGEHKETIESGCRAAAAGGFTAVCCMPNTTPALDNPETIEFVIRRAEEVGACRVYPVAAATKGRSGRELTDFAALRAAGAVAVTDDGDGIEDDAVMEQVFKSAKSAQMPVFPHCEFKELSHRGVMHLGPTSERLGLVGYDPRGEEAMIERDIAMAEKLQAHLHIAHISTAKGIEMVRAAKKRGANVTTEVCVHHLLLCDEDVIDAQGKPDPNFKMSPPLRSRTDVEACCAGVCDGTVDCIVTDHAPHAAEEKARGFVEAPMGIVGLETALGGAARALLGRDGFDWPELINTMSTKPASVMGLPGGAIQIGAPADLVAILPASTWSVDSDRFLSLSKNTPFNGWKLPAKIAFTWLNGKKTATFR